MVVVARSVFSEERPGGREGRLPELPVRHFFGHQKRYFINSFRDYKALSYVFIVVANFSKSVQDSKAVPALRWTMDRYCVPGRI